MTQSDTGIPRSLTHTIASTLCSAALLLGTTAWAHGAPAPPRHPNTAVPAAANHTMGSQIRLHEGQPADTAPPPGGNAPNTVDGMDVSGHQHDVDWPAWWESGMRFAYVKATEGTGFRNDRFNQQYDGSAATGMLRGAYHFALPDTSTGAEQANFFVDNGGGWSADGITLPGVLDMEYNPYGPNCYGKSPADLSAWVTEFSTTYHDRTGRWPVIYTSQRWWNSCVSTESGHPTPLWIARYSDSAGELPTGWNTWTFWQHTSKPLDKDRFNGTLDQLRTFATG